MLPLENHSPQGEARISASTVESLLSLHSTISGEIELLKIGTAAVPVLRQFLFTRVPSGIYQPRCSAVHVLTTLHANVALRDYLTSVSDASDPIERMGDEAVVNEAARALAKSGEPWVFDFLLDLSSRRVSPGIVDALGTFDRTEIIPILVAALEEDDTWVYSATALRRLGVKAHAALVHAASTARPSAANESQSSIRKRRRALDVLANSNLSLDHSMALSKLVEEQDPRIAFLVCKICLQTPGLECRVRAVQRLGELRTNADWILAKDIDHCLEKRR